ncbi:MAG: aminotransferase class V-fold PLP-dependent enzyme [Acidimicrobiia bacterium]|nr:aminotransferase class V-fold PLP-dependent enzyme [Acidimicrobiia bacterium]
MASWQLEPSVVHLNHGSFGACPVEVLEVQRMWRSQMEANPVGFMLETLQPALDDSRHQLSSFVKASAAGVVFVPNATFGVNSVLRSIEDRLSLGDEIIITNHGYNACNNAVAVSAAKTGAQVVLAELPFPVEGAQSVVDPILSAVTEKTRLVVVDHVTSPSGIVMPIEAIVAALEPDVPVLIDGAHAPGMVDVDLGRLDASFYTANCHKWMCAPKGSGFLYVAERHRDWMSAVVISHGHNDGWPGPSSPFHSRFDWTGTNDPTALLSVGSAIDVMDGHHPQGWDGVRGSNHGLALIGRAIVSSAVGSPLPVPDDMIGSIASILLPPGEPGSADIFDPLMTDLRRKWAIEVPVFSFGDGLRLLRVSAQQYNAVDDYVRLAEALNAEL